MKIKIIIATAFFVYFLVLTPKKIYSQNWSLTGNAPTPANFVGSFSNADLKFRTFNTQRMVILGGLPGGATTGFVGVNTAAPQNRLHLNDAATVYSQHTTTASGQTNTDGFWLGVSNLNAELRQKENAPMNFFTFDVQRMTILGTNGFVGINTTTPSVRLDVNGEARVRTLPTTSSVGIVSHTTNGTLRSIPFNGNTTQFLNGAGVFVTPPASVSFCSTLAVDNVPKRNTTNELCTTPIWAVGANVGIGSSTLATNPLFQLSVDRTININGPLPNQAYRINGNTVLQTPGLRNTMVGVEAGFFSPFSAVSDNTFVGNSSGLITQSSRNTFIGASVGINNNLGHSNTFVGSQSGFRNINGAHNDFFGWSAGVENTSGSQNTMIGHLAGRRNTTGSQNAYLGGHSGENNRGMENTFVGISSGSGGYGSSLPVAFTLIDSSVFLGRLAGARLLTGKLLTLIGYEASATNNLINAGCIGDYSTVTASNSFCIGALSSTVATRGVVNVGIGATAPQNKLEINSNDATPTSSTNGNSGLRFTDLTTASTPSVNPGTGVLSVDANGDVIYVVGGIGATGAAGATGTIGATGVTGTNGTNGLNGITGVTGATGTNGINGTNGATGATGTNGVNGTNGTNGLNGATGANGTNGINGINGATGATGSEYFADNGCSLFGGNTVQLGETAGLGGSTPSRLLNNRDVNMDSKTLSFREGNFGITRGNIGSAFVPSNTFHISDRSNTDNRTIALIEGSQTPFSTNAVAMEITGDVNTTDNNSSLLLLKAYNVGYGVFNGGNLFKAEGAWNKTAMVIKQNNAIGINVENPQASVHIIGDAYNDIAGASKCLLVERNNGGGSVGIAIHSKAKGNFNQNWAIYAEAESDASFNNIGVFATARDGGFNGALANTVTGSSMAIYARAVEPSGTANYGIRAEASNSTFGNWAGWFDGEVRINGNITGAGTDSHTSDGNLKDNVTPISNANALLSQLQPKTFTFDTAQYSFMNLPSSLQYGLIAQEVEPILPVLVQNHIHPAKYDTSGVMLTPQVNYKGLNYNAFIPILIAAVKEQKVANEQLNTELDSLQTVVSTLSSALTQCCNNGNGNGNGNNNDNDRVAMPSNENTNALEQKLLLQEMQIKEMQEALKVLSGAKELKDVNKVHASSVELNNNQAIVLNQNVPNPFAEKTTITYFIPEGTKMPAQLIFTDNNGKIIKTVEIEESGNGSITVYASNLSSGLYSYSLVVEGKTIDTKKMVCEK